MFMKIKRIVLITLAVMFYGVFTVCYPAEKYEINWDSLNLTPYQKKRIEMLDREWNFINATIRPGLENEQKLFEKFLNDPCSNEYTLRNLYLQILAKQNQLKYQALEVYLAKRRLLSKSQLNMMTEK